MKRMIKKIILVLYIFLFSFFSFCNVVLAEGEEDNDSFVIIPEAKTEVNVQKIWKEWWKVWENYNKEYENLNKKWDLGAQVASWIVWWDTILLLIKYFVKFLSQLGLVIWALMIIYAWYIYATGVFSWNVSKATPAIKNAIIWIVIIIWSYAIMKILVHLFL